jgi:nucleotide-binding universal stress UspA family protein
MSSGGTTSSMRCLVVGYDRTESARLAAAWAAARLLPDGKLVIVHACRPLHTPPSVLTSAQERRELGVALIDELMLEENGPLLDVEIEADISDSDPVAALIEAVARHGAEAIVLGHERHSALNRALGTVTSALLDIAPVPVIAVPVAVTARAMA